MAPGSRTSSWGPTTHSGTLVNTMGQASGLASLFLNTERRELAGMGVIVASDAPQIAQRLGQRRLELYRIERKAFTLEVGKSRPVRKRLYDRERAGFGLPWRRYQGRHCCPVGRDQAHAAPASVAESRDSHCLLLSMPGRSRVPGACFLCDASPDAWHPRDRRTRWPRSRSGIPPSPAGRRSEACWADIACRRTAWGTSRRESS